MPLFTSLYNKAILWAKHPHAPFYLAALSFAESSVFPIPPDIMLAPMSLANPPRIWRYALITTSFSILGSLIGYLLGACFIKIIYPWLVQFGYQPVYQQVEHWFLTWGIWILLLTGFMPIPYKIFTIGAGAVGMPLLPFFLASIISRSSRFYLVAALLHRYGEKMQTLIYQYADRAGWLFASILVLVCLIQTFR